MKVPKKIVILGNVESIVWSPSKSNQFNETSFYRRSFVLCCNATRTTLFFIQSKKTPIEPPPGVSAAMAAYELWSEFESNEFYKLNVPAGNLKRLGICKRVNYASDKWSGKITHYYHDFEKAAALYVDRPTNPRVYAVKYPRGIIVTNEGII